MSASAYRSPGTEARRVRDLDFARLPSVVRERLVGCLAKGGAPTPLLVDVEGGKPLSARLWLLIAAAAGVAFGAIWSLGFADPYSKLALHSPWGAAAQVIAIFLLLFAATRAARVARGGGTTRFRRGRFVFALDLIEADEQRIRVTELHTLRRIDVRSGQRGPSLVFVFADAHEIVFEDQFWGEVLAASLKAEIDAAAALVLPDDHAQLERRDPFFELRIADDWASCEIASNTRGSWLDRAPLSRLAAGIFAAAAIAGIGLHLLRNRISDDVMFERAVAPREEALSRSSWYIGDYTGVRHAEEVDTLRFARAHGKAEALESYRYHGGSHVDEAEVELFELVKGDESQLYLAGSRLGGLSSERVQAGLFELRKGDPAKLDRYLQLGGAPADRADDLLFAMARRSGEANLYRLYVAHGKHHLDEVRSVLLPEAEYLETKVKHDVGVMSAFVREHPASAHAEEMKSLIHPIYVEVLDAYRAKKPRASSLRFVTALLADLEERGDPSVIVAVTINDSASVTGADTAFAERYGADYLPAGPRINRQELEIVQRQVQTALSAWLTSSFPSGTVTTRDLPPGGSADGPAITLDCRAVAAETAMSPRWQIELADLRFHTEFRAVVPARVHGVVPIPSHLIAWEDTTSGLSLDEARERAEKSGLVALDRLELAQSMYARMMIVGMPQILERVHRDL